MAVDVILDRIAAALPWRIIGWGFAVLLLILPAVAMQFTSEVNWTASDFIFAAVVFSIVGAVLELAVWRSNLWSYRIAMGFAVACGFLHVWLTGAVGIIGNEGNPGNLVYLAIVAFAIFGSILALGRARAMSWTMLGTAAFELLTPLIAYTYVADPRGDVLAPEVFVATILFTSMWLVAAALFRKAASEEAR